MQFYQSKVTFDSKKNGKVAAVMTNRLKKYWGEEIFQDLNEFCLGFSNEKKIFTAVYNAGIGELEFIIVSNAMARLEKTILMKHLENILMCEPFCLKNLKIKFLEEITSENFKKLFNEAENNGFMILRVNILREIRKISENFSDSFFNSNELEIEEFLIDNAELSLQKALAESKKLMCEESFVEELQRIYSDKNPKKFFGHPVHYKITAHNSGGARNMAKLLCRALYENKRLVGRCVNFIHKIGEINFGKCDLEQIFEQSAGGTIILEMFSSGEEFGDYAPHIEEIAKTLAPLVKTFSNNTLFIFIELEETSAFASRLLRNLQEDIYLIDIKEGRGNRADAKKYLKILAEQDNFEIDDAEFENLLGNKTAFCASEVYEIYSTMCHNKLRDRVYLAYKQASRLMIVNDETTRANAYQTLQEMIGLEKIKSLVNQILDNAKIQKARSKFGLAQQKISLHMIFTGTPGTAKTTVARLLAKIFSQEGILESGEFIECGRSDLIGEYVGQTAPKVKHLFRLASGGILFIDEAYSLVDDYRKSYGDEAISTIVQEMENSRDDVIVIFAGYPDKMKTFLERNEGLKSRIAFHLDFPNYNAKELLQILQLMAKNKGFNLNSAIEQHCLEIFSNACNKENFGNGRFVRNLLEQALLKQSQRIVAENSGKEIGKAELLQLKVEDFEVNVVEQYSNSTSAIGFKI